MDETERIARLAERLYRAYPVVTASYASHEEWVSAFNRLRRRWRTLRRHRRTAAGVGRARRRSAGRVGRRRDRMLRPGSAICYACGLRVGS